MFLLNISLLSDVIWKDNASDILKDKCRAVQFKEKQVEFMNR